MYTIAVGIPSFLSVSLGICFSRWRYVSSLSLSISHYVVAFPRDSSRHVFLSVSRCVIRWASLSKIRYGIFGGAPT